MTSQQNIIARTISEADLQKTIIEYAEVKGWKVFHCRDSRRQRMEGLPDLLMIRERVVWAELKRQSPSRGKVTPLQQQVIDALVSAGQEVYLWRPEHWLSGEVEELLT